MGGLMLRGACLAVGLVASALAVPALAQDATDWSGFYAGVFAGYGLDTAMATSSNIPPVTTEVDPGEFLTIGVSEFDERFEAPFAGAQLGYNYQIDRFVLGVEGAVTLGGFDKARGTSVIYNFVDGADFSNNSIDSSTNFSLDWLTTFAGRAGMDFDGWLVYGKAGVAVADVSAVSATTYTVDGNVGGGLLGLPNGTYVSNGRSDVLRIGPVIGVGVEKKLTENVSLGLEYNYVRLGDVEVSGGGLGGIIGGGGGAQTFSANMHSVKAALNYHF